MSQKLIPQNHTGNGSLVILKFNLWNLLMRNNLKRFLPWKFSFSPVIILWLLSFQKPSVSIPSCLSLRVIPWAHYRCTILIKWFLTLWVIVLKHHYRIWTPGLFISLLLMLPSTLDVTQCNKIRSTLEMAMNKWFWDIQQHIFGV